MNEGLSSLMVCIVMPLMLLYSWGGLLVFMLKNCIVYTFVAVQIFFIEFEFLWIPDCVPCPYVAEPQRHQSADNFDCVST